MGFTPVLSEPLPTASDDRSVAERDLATGRFVVSLTQGAWCGVSGLGPVGDGPRTASDMSVAGEGRAGALECAGRAGLGHFYRQRQAVFHRLFGGYI